MLIFRGVPHFTPFFNSDPTPNRPFHPSRFADDGEVFFRGTGTTYTSDHSGKFGGWVGWLDPVSLARELQHLDLGPLNGGFFVKEMEIPENFREIQVGEIFRQRFPNSIFELPLVGHTAISSFLNGTVHCLSSRGHTYCPGDSAQSAGW